MKFIEKHYTWLSGVIIFIIYLFTLAPTVIQIDTGELAAVQYTFGIAHPTGYPVFTVLGHIFSRLPLPFSGILQLNMLAALYSTAAVVLFIYTFRMIAQNISHFRIEDKPGGRKSPSKKNRKKKEKKTKGSKKNASAEVKQLLVLPKALIPIAAVGGGFILALSKTFWFQSTAVEVYSLHTTLLMLVIFFVIKAYLYSKKHGSGDLKLWLVTAAVLALSFGNHLTTLLILPGIAYLYFEHHKFNESAFKRIGIMLAVFIPILIAEYGVLMIRSATDPLLDWGNPQNLENLIRHMSGRQYSIWMFSSIDAAMEQFSNFVSFLPDEFTISLVPALLGIVFLYSRAKKAFWFFGICFVFTILYAINYDIHDIESYFLLSFIALSFFAGFGLFRLYEMAASRGNPKTTAAVITAVLVAVQAVFIFPQVNQSGNRSFEQYTLSALDKSDKNAMIISYQWDHFISPSYYFHYVEDYRTDVIVIDKELLRRSWYYPQLESNFPDVTEQIKPEIETFLTLVEPFEEGENFNAQALEGAYQSVMTQLVATNIDERTVYIGLELVANEMSQGMFNLPPGTAVIPDLFFYRVVAEDRYYPAPDPDFTLEFHDLDNPYIAQIRQFVSNIMLQRVRYEIAHNKPERAKLYADKLIRDFEGIRIPPDILKALGYN